MILGKGRADDDTDREIDDVSTQGKFLEFFQHLAALCYSATTGAAEDYVNVVTSVAEGSRPAGLTGSAFHRPGMALLRVPR